MVGSSSSRHAGRPTLPGLTIVVAASSATARGTCEWPHRISVGLPAWRDDDDPTTGVETGSPHARYAIVERGPAGWDVTLRAVVYDWAAAARRAQDGGRPEWAHALATGRNG